MKETYAQIVERGARMMARIIKHTSKTTTIHALAEPGPVAVDLLVKIAECAEQHPDQDIVIYVQRVSMETIKEALKR